jgi:hypothetical protein
LFAKIFGAGVFHMAWMSSGSPEGRVKSALRGLDCSDRSFATIAVISVAEFCRVMNGKTLASDEADRLLDLVRRMGELQAAVGDAPINWTRTERVQVALAARLMDSLELGSPDHLVENAMKGVVQN